MKERSFVDYDLAALAVDCCVQAYNQYKQKGIFYAPHPFKILKGFQAKASGDTQWFGFILESEEMVVVTFRGTKTDHEWISDLAIKQVPFPYVSDAGNVHDGFLSVYQSCRENILDTLETLSKTKKLLVTGHSLGAALSTLHALDVTTNTPFATTLHYNFGSPKVGDKQFKELFNTTIHTSYRFVNLHDVVPLMPPNNPLSSPNKKGRYEHIKENFTIALNKGSLTNNHRIFAYEEAVNKLLQSSQRKQTPERNNL